MTEHCGFFNATNSSDPDRVYDSSDFAAYFASFIGNGVFAKHSDQLRVAQQNSPNMSVQVLGGQAWINGWWYENTSALNLSIDPADGTLDRIDIIVVQFNLTNREIKTIVRKGLPSAGATAPMLNRDDDLWELKLAEVNVSHGTLNITDGKITDTRSDNTVCGWVSGLIEQMDTTELFNQLKSATQDAIDAMKDAIAGTTAGNLERYRRSLRVESEIPASADLNDYQSAGNFGCSVARNVAGIKNKPSDLVNPFLLFVHSVGSFALQEVIDASNGSRWCRAGNGAWVGTKEWLLDNVYKIGYVWVSYKDESPSGIVGGTWTPITGVFPYFNAGTSTGGSNTQTLTVSQIPSHNHKLRLAWFNSSGKGISDTYSSKTNAQVDTGGTTGNAGGGQPHNNMPAYQTLYAWRRTA